MCIFSLKNNKKRGVSVSTLPRNLTLFEPLHWSGIFFIYSQTVLYSLRINRSVEWSYS